MASAPFTVGLHEIHYHEPDDKACVDIIAIHGLDTKSPDTWLWRPETKGEPGINWLDDPKMLPSIVEQARIFTCDWPANMFIPEDKHEGGLREASRSLLASILSRSSPNFHGNPAMERPIVFIASCLGGIILMQALTMATEEYLPILRATRGIVFLATPFRGTSFEHIAEWAEKGLRVWASMQNSGVTNLLEFVKRNVHLNELVREFTRLSMKQRYRVQTFYELRDTSLSAKVPGVNALPDWMLGKSLKKRHLVNEESASLDIVPHPLPLDRPHITMNKFGHPNDADYQRLSGSIRLILSDVRQASCLAAEDNIIRKHYTSDMLRIQRLSGDFFPMERCYINLTLVEQQDLFQHRFSDQGAQNKESDDPRGSSLSLISQPGTNTPTKEIQVDLEKIFDTRKGLNGTFAPPRRILIYGRAGVGKSTLCKKIVYNFTHLGAWGHLFDRVIWIPLRNLKNKEIIDHNLEGLFFAEFFSQNPDGHGHAETMWHALEAMQYGRTLFILDGLDEISEAFDPSQKLKQLLETLLNLPNVIITTRPHVNISSIMGKPLDLQLETVGFTSEQVNRYLEAAVDKDTARRIQSFIKDHAILQSLVKIPIQLDAVCYIWGKHDTLHAPQTMTALYQSLEASLWEKDIRHLDQRTQKRQKRMIEAIAFSGLLGNIVNFDFAFREKISRIKFLDGFSSYPTWEDDLAKVSFMRASDSPASHRDRTYHFLHLTFQEYFAALYFVRHCEANTAIPYLNVETSMWSSNSIAPTRLVQEQKYTARLDIFWRFVCGLLNDNHQVTAFFKNLDDEPRNLVGLEHLRLIVHCLNELPETAPIRKSLMQGGLARMMQGYSLSRTLLLRATKELSSEDFDSLWISVFISSRNREDSDTSSPSYNYWINRHRPDTLQFCVNHLRNPNRVLPFLSPRELGNLGYQNIDALNNDLEAMHQQPLVLERMMRQVKEFHFGNLLYRLIQGVSNLSKQCQDRLVDLLQSEGHIQTLAASILREREEELSPRIFERLFQLYLQKGRIRRSEEVALESRKSMSMALNLMDKLGVLDHSQISLYSNLPPEDFHLPRNLSGALKEKLVSCQPEVLEQIDDFFHEASRLNLPEELAQALRTTLDHSNGTIRNISLAALCLQEDWQDWVAGEVSARLLIEGPPGKLAILNSIDERDDKSRLPGELLQAMRVMVSESIHAPFLEDRRPLINKAIELLTLNRERLPAEHLKDTIFELLQDGKEDFTRLFFDACGVLPPNEELFQTILLRLHEPNKLAGTKHHMALDALWRLTKEMGQLPAWVLSDLVKLIRKDPHGTQRRGSLIRFLSDHGQLSGEMFYSIFSVLNRSERAQFTTPISEALCRHQIPANAHHLGPFFVGIIAFNRYFHYRMSVYIDGEYLCINTPQSLNRLLINNMFPSEVKRAITRARTEAKYEDHPTRRNFWKKIVHF